jgi:hypothetical protein
MKDENSTWWSSDIQFIAHKKNNCYHEGFKLISYVLKYGQPCRFRLHWMNLTPGLLSRLQTEEDLEAAMAQAKVITALQAVP